jgi:LacI family transcriptional regulator, galactose operon repressor
MRDVAQAAGVSLKTVSRVVNGEAGVGTETATRVTQAIEALGFYRNEIARSLRPGQASATVGLVIGDVSNPFYSTIARAVEQVARARRHMLITASSEDDPGLERDVVHTMSRYRVDGLLIVPAGRGGHQRYLERELSMGTPVVFLDRPPAGVAADMILLDNVGGARLAVEHLLAHGHRRIGVVGDAPSFSTVLERLEGYRLALAAAGLPVEDSLVRLSPHNTAEAESVADALLAQRDPPTAIFTTNNRMSIGVLRALRGRGRRIALVGFDDFELADMLATPITVVAHDPSEMGRLGAELLFARLAGNDGPPKRLVLTTTLVVRGSGEIPA